MEKEKTPKVGGGELKWARPVLATPARQRKKQQQGSPRSRKQHLATQRRNSAARILGSCWMLAGSGLFFLLAWYHYHYLGQLIAMAGSTVPGSDLDQIRAVHQFYSKTYLANLSLGGVATVAGLAMATNRVRLATLVIGLWALALAVSQGLTLYTMYADNILLETYIKGGLVVGAVVLLYWQRSTLKTG